MTITFVQRSLIIFAVLLCYYQSWVGAVDCEQEPYHPSCRGSQARKRLVPLPVMRALDCDETDCKFPKFFIAVIDNTPYRNNEAHPFNSESNSIHVPRKRMRENSKDVYLDDY